MTATKLDPFTQAYVECALWSSTDNSNEQGGKPLDADYGIDDIEDATLAQMITDCELFQADNRTDLDACDLSFERQGHDFWLTRNRHGSGFWDEGYRQSEIINGALKRLTDASHAYGSFDLYVTDEGKVAGS